MDNDKAVTDHRITEDADEGEEEWVVEGVAAMAVAVVVAEAVVAEEEVDVSNVVNKDISRENALKILSKMATSTSTIPEAEAAEGIVGAAEVEDTAVAVAEEGEEVGGSTEAPHSKASPKQFSISLSVHVHSLGSVLLIPSIQ